MLFPVVLAGGVGSRLWPVSRKLLPKQFVSFPNQEYTLFQSTLLRLSALEDLGQPIVVCNEDHRFLVAEQLREIGVSKSTILLEPVGRNTAPAVALAALAALELNADASLLVLPSDHVIQDCSAFLSVIGEARVLVKQEKLTTFGIVAGAPETGYGYIEVGPSLNLAAAPNSAEVARFVEKPDRDTAQSYLDAGNFCWNSGMFMFSAATYLSELASFDPQISNACRLAYENIDRQADFQRIPFDDFANCPSDSIDYAVMEKTKHAAVIPLDAGWNDLGAWQAMAEVQQADANGNVFNGDVLSTESHNNYVLAQSRLVATVGLEDTVVIETADAVLVAARDKLQSVKTIVEQLESNRRSEAENHTLVKKPWGSYESLAVGDGFQVKHIVVQPGASLSLQMHHKRAEHWTIIHGQGVVQLGDSEFILNPNESIFIPLGSTHRMTNLGDVPVEFVEVQVGSYLGEDDIVRLEDVYGRVSAS